MNREGSCENYAIEILSFNNELSQWCAKNRYDHFDTKKSETNRDTFF